MLLIDLGGIEFIGHYDTGKSEPGFQVKSSGLTTLHKCSDEPTVQTWVDKVMTAKLGPSKPESDPEDSLDSDASEELSTSGEEQLKPNAEAARKSAKSEDKSKSKLKSSGSTPSKSSKSKSKSETSSSKSSKSKHKKEKTRDKDSKKSKHSTSKDKSDEEGGKSSKRSKTASSTDSYIPQWAAHYNGIKQQERQKYFEGLSTQELVKLVSGGLEVEANAAKERVLQEWSTTKRAKLLELHALELSDLQKKQQKELDDISKRMKEFMEQT